MAAEEDGRLRGGIANSDISSAEVNIAARLVSRSEPGWKKHSFKRKGMSIAGEV
jgi:hypothetical protein